MKLLAILILTLLTACGGNDEDETDAKQSQPDKTVQPVNCQASGVCA